MSALLESQTLAATTTLSHCRRQRGAVIVEMAIAAVFLMLFLFGTTEVCLLVKDETALGNITRVCARCWSLGDTASVSTSTAVNSSQSNNFTTSNIAWTFEYSVDGGTTWTAMTSGSDAAPYNSLVRVKTVYLHRFYTKFLGGGSIAINKQVVYRHE